MAEESEVAKMNIDQAIELLTSSSNEITSCWNEFIKEEYGKHYADDRDDLVDIITLVDYIVGNLKKGITSDFKAFFSTVENIIESGDDTSRELIIVGILEGLQNNCGIENIDHHNAFDIWLLPKTKKIWDGLIYLWESNDSMEEKQERLKDFKL